MKTWLKKIKMPKFSFTKQDAVMLSICFLTFMVMCVEPTFAQVPQATQNSDDTLATYGGAGQKMLGTVTAFFGSNVALLIGLALAAAGAYQWLVAQNTGLGIGMLVFGALLAVVPDLFTGVGSAVQGLVRVMGGGA